MVAGRLSRLIEPAVLYLLGKGEAVHGYDLIAEVNELGMTDTPADAAAIYRCLRGLEEEGAVISDWDTSGGGPARRNYELTALGRARLQSWVKVIARRAEAMRDFVKQAEKLLDAQEEGGK
ncbi:MAG: helix-turn-helix transcriptional regulator [Armatimonadetes bacterium]|nr:helix-turn-helix transcriptional regulator [Armatimonadota bacterium]